VTQIRSGNHLPAETRAYALPAIARAAPSLLIEGPEPFPWPPPALRGRRPRPSGSPPAGPAKLVPLPSGRASSRASSRELLRRYHEHGDRAARDRLIEQYLPLVRRLAYRFAGRGEQVEDLVQVGSIGLIKAIDRFEPNRGAELGSFAIPTIAGEIRRHLRDRVWPVRVPRRLQELGFSLANGSHAPAELARDAGVEKDLVVEALAAVQSLTPRSLSAPSRDHEGGAGPSDVQAIEGGYEHGEDRVLLERAFRVLDKRERRVLHLCFFEGLSQLQIGRQVGISQVHVSRLTRRALEKLRAEIGSDPAIPP
jgi:RNA polymerase sigma-B factor